MGEDTRTTEETEEDLDQQMKKLEEDPPDKLEDWPDGKLKYRTMGGSEQDSGYEDGPTSKLGPAEVRYHEDGTVTVKGEEVDNPDDFKGEPIPGGPTDPNAVTDPGKPEEDDDADESDDSEDQDQDQD